MIQQLNQPITFEAFYVAAQVGKTGLTVTVDVYQPDGTQVVTAAAATPTGGGLYRYPLANPAYTGGYRAIFHTTDTTVDQRDIPSLWEVGVAGVQNLDVLASTRLAASAYTVQTGDAFARLGAAGAGLTALGDTRIANLDAAVSTRLAASAYTVADNADIVTALADLVTLLGRTDPTTAITAIKAMTDKLQFDGSNYVKSAAQNLPADYQQRGVPVTLPVGEDGVIQADVRSALTAQGYTVSRSTFLDLLVSPDPFLLGEFTVGRTTKIGGVS